jgi:Domain of unknown function (DUF892)
MAQHRSRDSGIPVEPRVVPPVWATSPPPPAIPCRPKQELSMGLFTRDIKTMDDLFLHTLQDIYYAENKIVKSLPDMIANATDVQLSPSSFKWLWKRGSE